MPIRTSVSLGPYLLADKTTAQHLGGKEPHAAVDAQAHNSKQLRAVLPGPLPGPVFGVSLVSRVQSAAIVGAARGIPAGREPSRTVKEPGEGRVLALPLELVQHQPLTAPVPFPQSVARPTGLLVFIAFLIDGIWRLARHISVIAHEGAHVVAGWSMGHRVTSVTLNRDATGETTTRGPAGFRSVIVGFAGYLGPSLFGLAAAWLIAQDQITIALELVLVCLAIMLILIRNFFGVISVVLNGVIVFVVLRYGGPEVQAVAACALSWFLLFSGVRWVLMHGTGAGDAVDLTRNTHIPRFIWVMFWLAITVAALWAGGHLLL